MCRTLTPFGSPLSVSGQRRRGFCDPVFNTCSRDVQLSRTRLASVTLFPVTKTSRCCPGTNNNVQTSLRFRLAGTLLGCIQPDYCLRVNFPQKRRFHSDHYQPDLIAFCIINAAIKHSNLSAFANGRVTHRLVRNVRFWHLAEVTCNSKVKL